MDEHKRTTTGQLDSQRSAANHERSPSRPSYSLDTWTGAAFADNRILYISVGVATVLFGSIGTALWLCR